MRKRFLGSVRLLLAAIILVSMIAAMGSLTVLGATRNDYHTLFTIWDNSTPANFTCDDKGITIGNCGQSHLYFQRPVDLTNFSMKFSDDLAEAKFYDITFKSAVDTNGGAADGSAATLFTIRIQKNEGYTYYVYGSDYKGPGEWIGQTPLATIAAGEVTEHTLRIQGNQVSFDGIEGTTALPAECIPADKQAKSFCFRLDGTSMAHTITVSELMGQSLRAGAEYSPYLYVAQAPQSGMTYQDLRFSANALDLFGATTQTYIKYRLKGSEGSYTSLKGQAAAMVLSVDVPGTYEVIVCAETADAIAESRVYEVEVTQSSAPSLQLKVNGSEWSSDLTVKNGESVRLEPTFTAGEGRELESRSIRVYDIYGDEVSLTEESGVYLFTASSVNQFYEIRLEATDNVGDETGKTYRLPVENGKTPMDVTGNFINKGTEQTFHATPDGLYFAGDWNGFIRSKRVYDVDSFSFTFAPQGNITSLLHFFLGNGSEYPFYIQYTPSTGAYTVFLNSGITEIAAVGTAQACAEDQALTIRFALAEGASKLYIGNTEIALNLTGDAAVPGKSTTFEVRGNTTIPILITDICGQSYARPYADSSDIIPAYDVLNEVSDSLIAGRPFYVEFTATTGGLSDRVYPYLEIVKPQSLGGETILICGDPVLTVTADEASIGRISYVTEELGEGYTYRFWVEDGLNKKSEVLEGTFAVTENNEPPVIHLNDGLIPDAIFAGEVFYLSPDFLDSITHGTDVDHEFTYELKLTVGDGEISVPVNKVLNEDGTLRYYEIAPTEEHVQNGAKLTITTDAAPSSGVSGAEVVELDILAAADFEDYRVSIAPHEGELPEEGVYQEYDYSVSAELPDFDVSVMAGEWLGDVTKTYYEIVARHSTGMEKTITSLTRTQLAEEGRGNILSEPYKFSQPGVWTVTIRVYDLYADPSELAEAGGEIADFLREAATCNFDVEVRNSLLHLTGDDGYIYAGDYSEVVMTADGPQMTFQHAYLSRVKIDRRFDAFDLDAVVRVDNPQEEVVTSIDFMIYDGGSDYHVLVRVGLDGTVNFFYPNPDGGYLAPSSAKILPIEDNTIHILLDISSRTLYFNEQAVGSNRFDTFSEDYYGLTLTTSNSNLADGGTRLTVTEFMGYSLANTDGAFTQAFLPLVAVDGVPESATVESEVALPQAELFSLLDDFPTYAVSVTDPDGNPVAVEDMKFTPAVRGDYTVTYTATDLTGESNSVEFQVRVILKSTQPPVIEFETLPPSELTEGEVLTLPKYTVSSDTGETPDVRCVVENSMGLKVLPNEDGTYTLKAGTYKLTYTVTDIEGKVTRESFDIVVKAAEEEPPQDTGCGCGAVTAGGMGMRGGALLLLAAIALISIKRRKINENL